MATGSETLSARLKALRTARGLSQQQLADRAGLTKSNVTQLEQGRITDPRLSTLRALAGALEVRIDEVTGDAPMPQVEKFPAEGGD
jgi:transcriptional regulator with XRE-family HTH domain